MYVHEDIKSLYFFKQGFYKLTLERVIDTVKIKDIARLAGVSIGTVDRVLHNRAGVSTVTREKILRIIDDYGYKPNITAQSLVSRRVWKFGLLLPEGVDEQEYWYYPVKGIYDAARQYQNVTMEIKEFRYSFYNSDMLVQKCDELLRSDVDAVITAPVHQDIITGLLDELDSRKIPVVLIDSDTNIRKRLACVSQEPSASGQVAARLVGESLPECASTILVFGALEDFPDNPVLNQRVKAFSTYIKELNEKVNVVELIGLAANTEDNFRVLDDAFQLYPDIHAIFVPNSRAYLVAGYLKSSGNKPHRVVGYDLIDKNRLFLEDGFIDYLICQQPGKQGYEAFKLLYNNLIQNRGLDDELSLIPIDVIMKENVASYNH